MRDPGLRAPYIPFKESYKVPHSPIPYSPNSKRKARTSSSRCLRKVMLRPSKTRLGDSARRKLRSWALLVPPHVPVCLP